MSEQLRPGAEYKNEHIDTSQESEANLKRLQEAARERTEAGNESVSNLEMAAKTEAVSGQEITIGEHEAASHSQVGVHRELKQTAYDRSMERIRSKLSPPARVFSKVIHNPAVEIISNGTAKTLARPSGILGGATAALIGSLVLLYLTKHYGFAYNYLLFVFLYIGGYFLGLLTEILLKLFRR